MIFDKFLRLYALGAYKKSQNVENIARYAIYYNSYKGFNDYSSDLYLYRDNNDNIIDCSNYPLQYYHQGGDKLIIPKKVRVVSQVHQHGIVISPDCLFDYEGQFNGQKIWKYQSSIPFDPKYTHEQYRKAAEALYFYVTN